MELNFLASIVEISVLNSTYMNQMSWHEKKFDVDILGLQLIY